jgi:hypothetical protein
VKRVLVALLSLAVCLSFLRNVNHFFLFDRLLGDYCRL